MISMNRAIRDPRSRDHDLGIHHLRVEHSRNSQYDDYILQGTIMIIIMIMILVQTTWGSSYILFHITPSGGMCSAHSTHPGALLGSTHLTLSILGTPNHDIEQSETRHLGIMILGSNIRGMMIGKYRMTIGNMIIMMLMHQHPRDDVPRYMYMCLQEHLILS